MADPVQVAHVFIEMPVGGAEDLVATIVHQKDEAVSHRIICLKQPGRTGEEMIRAGDPIECPGWVKSKRFNPLAAWRLSRWIKQSGIDVVYSHVYNAHVYASLAAKWSGLPHVMHHHKTFRQERRRRQMVMRRMVERSHQHVTLSEATREDLMSSYRIPAARVRTLSNPIPLPREVNDATIRDVRETTGTKQQLLIGCIGSLSPQKNHTLLVEVAKHLKSDHIPIKLVVCGEGVLRDRLETEVRDSELKNYLEFVGVQRPIDPWMAAFDAMILPSTWEGEPMVLLQALSRRTPILASRIEGNVSILGENHPGLFDLAPGAASAIALVKRIHDDPAFKQKLLQHQDAKRADRLDTDAYVQTLNRLICTTHSNPPTDSQT